MERLKSEFVSVVSHELRTPMTSIKTSLALLLAGASGTLDPAAREMLEIALRNADRLIRLVNDLLDLSRIEARRMEFQLEAVPLAAAMSAPTPRNRPLVRTAAPPCTSVTALLMLSGMPSAASTA